MFFWMLLLGLLAQVTPGNPVTITLNGDSQPVDVVYNAGADEQITVIAHSIAEIDVTLGILLDNQRLAFNDDHGTDRADLRAQDAAIENLVLPGAGTYTIRVNSFNGVQTGEVEIGVESAPVIAACQLPTQVVKFRPDSSFNCTLSATSDTTMTITARDLSGTLDPVLSLLDSTSNRVAYNDDHSTASLSLDTLDAQISNVTLKAGEIYTIRVTDFSGETGIFELQLDIAP
jgi:hypothetical protein